jgi:hypothetical protein
LHRGDGSINCTLDSAQHKFHISIVNFFVSAAAVVVACFVVVAALVAFWAVSPFVSLLTTLIALALEWSCPLLVRAVGLLIVASAVFLVWAITCLVPLFAAMIACALELNVPQGHFVSIAIALVSAHTILIEFAWL